MARIALYLDEEVKKTLARILRERGFDAISAHEAGMLGRSDSEQLNFAKSNNRAILTHNIGDYVDLAREYAYQDRPHCGIIVSNQLTLRELLRRILRLLSTYSAEEMKNRFEWLHNFKN
ncbi:MAG: DUF5615 family PIN-like protein [Methanosarcinales archaeon]